MAHIDSDYINDLIKDSKDLGGNVDTNKISDGYHTFGELYEHRIALFIALCNHRGCLFVDHEETPADTWKSMKHGDGTEWEGWFIAGIGTEKGKQISYHLPIKYWDDLNVEVLDKAPEWDGHTPDDVIKRLKTL